ncbi:MAG: hypothetical protein FWE87_06045 [Coriobacteriia bacterium]|nr:hypothetical protein [Coriobacteriia bacterium]
MYLAPCGISCECIPELGNKPCPLKEQCGGNCHEVQGKPFYVKDFGVELCPIYDCAVNKKGFDTCAPCEDLPCQIYIDWKDPEMSEDDHLKSISERTKVLKASVV